MAKKATKKKVPADPLEPVDFEQAIRELEQIVAQLESGQLGLDQSLAEYEAGVQRLKQCYRLIEKAERRIALLRRVDESGQPILEAFDDSQGSLEEKAQARGARRSRPARDASHGGEGGKNNVDSGPGLF